MTRQFLYILALTAASFSASAQSWLDYDQALFSWEWQRAANPATLTTYRPADSTQWLLADAQVAMSTAHGHWAPMQASPHQWAAQAGARSVFRANGRVVMRGSMGYLNQWGSQAIGSVWSEPREMPFDIVEYTDSTRGNISMERYRLNGEVGVSVGGGLALGAQFAYTAATTTKQKDPRHTNSHMTLNAGAGAVWQGAGITLGAAYLLRRTTEAVQFSTYGSTDRVYHYLIDFGATYGRDERTDGRGYTNSDSEHPLLDMRHGLTLQAGYKWRQWSVGGEWQWRHRHGHYGLQAPATIDFNKHRGNCWAVDAWLQHATPTRVWRVEAQWSRENLRDYERTYNIVTQNGVTDIVYYDNRLMGTRQTSNYTLRVDTRWGIRRQLAKWQADATIAYRHGDVLSIVYPYYRHQDAHTTCVTASVQRNWLTGGDRVWSLALAAHGASGSGTPARDDTYGTPADGNTPPPDLTGTLWRQYDLLTAPNAGFGIDARHSLPVSAHLRLYIDAVYHFAWAWDTHYSTRPHRHTATLAVGCLF